MQPSDMETPRGAIDTVELNRMERLIDSNPKEFLAGVFTQTELDDAGDGEGRVASLSARFAAKEACLKLFPKETALGSITAADFSVKRDAYGAPEIEASPRGEAVMGRYRVKRIRASLTHTEFAASAIVWAEPKRMRVPWYGWLMYKLFPIRKGVVMRNLTRVFSDVLPKEEIERLAQAFYGHFITFFVEFARLRLMSEKRRKAWVRIENHEALESALAQGKGALLLTGHFGNWEVATVAGIGQAPQFKGRFHFVRRPFKPKWLNDRVTRRFQRSGFGTLTKRDSLERILQLLGEGSIIVFILDQHANHKDGFPVEFLGHRARTFKSLAIIAVSTGTPVVPASSWREPDGSHVLRFEDALPVIEHPDPGEEIRLNTRAYNEALEQAILRHPEQWIWMHKRWKHLDGE